MTTSKKINFYRNVVELSEEYNEEQLECGQSIVRYLREKSRMTRQIGIPCDLIGSLNYSPEELMVESFYKIFALHTLEAYVILANMKF